MTARRRTTLRRIVRILAPVDARAERVAALAVEAIDALSPARRGEMEQLLDLLALPVAAGAGAATLRAFADAPVTKLRSGFAALKRLVLFLAYAESEPGAGNPTWQRIGYPGPRDHHAVPEPPLALSAAHDGERVDADVLVIGSGAGGGVAAAAFARAGKRVVVLEAGGAVDASAVTQREISMRDLYLDAGMTASDDLGIAILAGATLGGGTTVNWCTSLRLPAQIAAEWEAASGIARLGADLERAYDDVALALALAPAARHNANNRTIVDGCAALGLAAEAVPRNAPPDCGDGCGYCGYGCAYAKKRSTMRTFLPQVVERGGAIYVNARAERVLFDGNRARGAVVVQTVDGAAVRFEVAAPLVVVAAGTLRTPGLLARSGVAHPLLGRRLFLHPVGALVGEFAEPIESFRGPMQSACTDAFNYVGGSAYGPKIEVAPSHPGIAALSTPWRARAEHAAEMERFPYGASMIAVTRDRDPGTISLDDEARIAYRLSPHDGANVLLGIAGMADLLFAAGALRVRTLHSRPLELTRERWNATARAAFAARLARIGCAPNRQILFSAHQMGTAAMAHDPQRGVVDERGAVFGREGLLVVDAAVFPQSSGVNPMLTIAANAQRIALLHGGSPLAVAG